MPFTTSIQPRRQRLSLYTAPLHLRHKLFNAKLSPDLQKKLGVKRLPVRRGDTVMIMRGDFKGVTGKVVKVDLKKVRIYVEGATRTNSKGQTVYYPIHPSKVMIIDIDTSDKIRQKIIQRRKKE
ncbi:LSU ribosomal protein L24P [Pyrobaculum islandicum DSM 4184]|uniref:Large ribosomal subunit protein uL24 n=1 Tax=Pyrobaculum islandicum (strain DSM 4184 / JCM 9189 / GEO3) TaxID=384616 RepID=RL24_PYRIL|nr:50S ribosomal protein L24 [Pyrobaculum islandicum]A1RS05.1 RecName: Full=Large ribosomal subunit protein uL24; AltName: Full=50S ribosomal protein L24 [Pyrobaculum islandicum DSM 4184]ABL87737.1 LSU ribosomal protein L24P [Pyrobaculum islandicum DSM 4184]